MAKPLRVLVVEDNERDADILVRELRRGYQLTFERVETAPAMREALDRETWDVVVSDYSLPSFGATAALAIVKEQGLDLPFIIVSGTIGEETAVDAMRAGAHDFMTKHKFARLLPAIERELQEAAMRAERTKLREQLLISDRMASVGTLAAGVAHEINNPLAAVMANIDFAHNDLTQLLRNARFENAPGAPSSTAANSGWAEWLSTRVGQILQSLDDAKESSERVRVIVRDLKTFSRGDEERRGPVDVRRVIDSALRMAWNEVHHRARLVKDYGDVPLVVADEARLGQVILNLVVNAAQAIPEGRAESQEICITTRLDSSGRVVVEVRDTGSGIPEAILGRIFDVFFTTKPIGEGTGLGLAICHRIVTSFGGEITVDSREGRGSTFRVSLPVAKTEEVAAAPIAAPIVRGRRGRILVVDDQPLMVSVVRQMLTGEHDVVAVTSGREAVDRVVARGERFDLILCDLMMPQVTGMDLHAELTGSAGDQAERIVFMTGGAFTPRARQFLDDVPNARIEKPFDAPGLRALIRNLLH